MTFDGNPTRGKDRPVLVIRREDERTVQALLLASRLRRSRGRNWLKLSRGVWDGQGRRSFVRLDRVLELDETSLRREGRHCHQVSSSGSATRCAAATVGPEARPCQEDPCAVCGHAR